MIIEYGTYIYSPDRIELIDNKIVKNFYYSNSKKLLNYPFLLNGSNLDKNIGQINFNNIKDVLNKHYKNIIILNDYLLDEDFELLEKRLCNKCGNKMSEGYIYNGETYCCETCLPISKEQFESEYTDDGENCWTQWENEFID